MTFLEIINEAKMKYHPQDEVVLFEILYTLSKKVKTKLQYTDHRNTKIDFVKLKYFKKLNEYFLEEKPLGQIARSTTFCGVKIDIYDHIFEPRHETEYLTEIAVKLLKKGKYKNGIDLCCGTGCIGIAIKKAIPIIKMTSVDINATAVINTIHNAKINNVKLNAVCADALSLMIDKYDFIVCNPPYVNAKDVKSLTKYETAISFNNSNDELYFYKKILKDVFRLKKRMLILFEVGHNQKEPLFNCLKKLGLDKQCKFFKDLIGSDRILAIIK
ncbi:release factor glutamine methyltransferase [Bacilli bacterium]|nr:release factor glutamine methyltransferase [Bacilli bacterium]